MQQFKKYDKYKDSGLDWLGEIPAGWVNFRINKICIMVRGNTGFKKDELLEKGEFVALQYGKTYKVDEINNSFNFYVNSEFFKPDQTVHKGEIVLISTSETIDDLGHSFFYNRSDVGLLGGEQILLKPRKNLVHQKYLYYFTKVISDELRTFSTGLKVFRFSVEDLKNITLPLPPLKTQIKIAEFLDTRAAAIDAEIELLTTKAFKYKQLKQSLINKAATKGLNPSAEMKETGIDWIGSIPKGWEVRRLENLISLQNGFAFDSSVADTTGIPIIKMSNLKLGKISILDNNQTAKVSKDLASYLLKSDDILLGLSGSLENFAQVNKNDLPLYLNQRVCAIRNKAHLETNLLLYYIQSSMFTEQVAFNSTGTTITNLSTNILLKFNFLLPLKDEQVQITEYLDAKTGQIDQIISTINKKVLKLKMYRKVLINDVVTGKINVEGV